MSERKSLWRRLYEGWLLIAAQFSEVQTLIIVAVVYTGVMGPVALIMAAGRGDPLHKRGLGLPGTAWRDAESNASPDVERAKRLF
jgi:hypothetical protein